MDAEAQSERGMIVDAVRALLASAWPAGDAVKRSADATAVSGIWQQMVGQGFAAIGSDPELGGLAAGVSVMRELGRAGCPVPLAPHAVAGFLARRNAGFAGLLADFGPVNRSALAIGFARLDGDINAGCAEQAGGCINGAIRFVESAATATHFLVVVRDGMALVAADAAGLELTATPGLAVPPLTDLRFEDVPARFVAIDEGLLEDAAALARLLLLARAEGAARQAFELAVVYVQERVQFGQALARFQSMQHKLADCILALDATWLMIETAASAFDTGGDWSFQVDAALACGSGQLRKTSLETHHAFGAIGYAEEHEAPRHFRRVHADVARMGGQSRARVALAARLLAADSQGLPERSLGVEAEAFRIEARQWLDQNWTAQDRAASRARPFHERGWSADFDHKLGRDGWIGLAWPESAGGKGLSPLCQLALVDELAFADAPTSGISAANYLIAPEIIRHGSAWLRETFLPGIRAGDIRFALGYSEPQAGSDLTSLRTRAVREGDHFIITGQKMWGTGTERATHIAMAVRTNPEAKKSAGISVILVPADLPGITIKPDMALYGHHFCTQFFDEVRVPAGYLLGEENGGWAILTGALAAERILMGGNVVAIQKLFETLCRYVAGVPRLRDDAAVRTMLGQFAAEIDAARQLALHSVRVLQSGRLPLVEGAMAKVFSGDLTERFAEAAIDMLGTAGTLGEDAPNAPLDGAIEQALRRSIMLVIGGGAAEIQKTLIAQRGIGLAR